MSKWQTIFNLKQFNTQAMTIHIYCSMHQLLYILITSKKLKYCSISLIHELLILVKQIHGKSSESVQYAMLKAYDACADMGQL